MELLFHALEEKQCIIDALEDNSLIQEDTKSAWEIFKATREQLRERMT